MYHANTSESLATGIREELQQNRACCFFGHVVQVDGISSAEVATPQALEQPGRVTGPDEQKLFAGFDFIRVFVTQQEFAQYGFFILQGLTGYCFRLGSGLQ